MYMFLRKFNRMIVKAEEMSMIVMLAAIVIIMTMQVTMRYIFQSPLTWSQELSILILIYLSFISADVVLYQKGHIGITYFVEILPKKFQRIVTSLVYMLIIGAFLLIIPKTFQLMKMQSGHIIAGVLPFSKSVWIFPIALTFPLMVVKCLEFILENFMGLAEDRQKEGV